MIDRTLHGAVLTSIGAFAMCAQASAQDTKSGPALEEIVVTGYRFLNEDTSGTTNLPLPIEEVPQSISLISNDFLKAADIKSLGEVAQYTPGAIYSGNTEGYRTTVKLRGFSPGEAVDGLPLGGGDAISEYDYAVVDRLEIVKGPSSVVYGASSPGGIVNIVTKKARPETAEYLSLDIGMWNNYRVEGQAGGAVDSEGRISVIGVGAYEQGDSFMDVMNHDRTVLYGGVDIAITDSVSAYVRSSFESNTRTSFDGIPTFADGTPAPVPRSFFIGSDDPRFELQTDRSYVNAGLDWDVTELWSIAVKTNYTRSDHKGAAAYAGELQDNGDIFLSVDEDLRSTHELFAAGITSIYKLDRLGLSESFISLGAVYNDHEWNAARRLYFVADPANIFDGVQAISNAYESEPVPGLIRRPHQEDSLLTYSAQAVLKVIDPLTVLLGASYSGTDYEFYSTTLPRSEYEYSGEVSYRGGLTYEFAQGLNGYLSYSESFLPQTVRDVNENPLKPLIGEQKEVGVKYAPQGGRTLFTAALFEIVQSNKPEFDQVTELGDRFKPMGEVRHRGAELEVVGRLADRWQIHAGYAYLDPEITRNGEEPELVGKTITYLPNHTASAFASYELTDSFTLGAGVRYVDSVKTTYDSSVKDLPAYTIVDATASYIYQNWRFQLNAHNLFDEKYYINTYETVYYGNVVGEPANVSVSVRYEF
ncbi:TonB-dependent siderophore receptor [Steroidobacter flavus]|uniref:TonB-dependent siderophore receptor n=1 Tax=Steroidobacter flavus TaxID=1842136 RepID=A0ABV8T3U9_9GAMM